MLRSVVSALCHGKERKNGSKVSLKGFGFRAQCDEWLEANRRSWKTIDRQRGNIRAIERMKVCLNWVSMLLKYSN